MGKLNFSIASELAAIPFTIVVAPPQLFSCIRKVRNEFRARISRPPRRGINWFVLLPNEAVSIWQKRCNEKLRKMHKPNAIWMDGTGIQSTVEFRLISSLPPLSSGILAIHSAAQQRVITVTMVISNTLMTEDHAASFANKCWATNW